MAATKSAQTLELAKLVARQAELEQQVAEVRTAESAAHEEVRAASDQVVALERRAAGGETVTETARREAENELLRAKSRALAPWSERRQAAALAVDDQRRRVSAFVLANLDALLSDLAAEAEVAAVKMDAAAEAVRSAHAEWWNVSHRTFALLSLVGPTTPGDVARSRADALAQEARRLLQSGGEQAPVVLRRPGQPQHAAAIPWVA